MTWFKSKKPEGTERLAAPLVNRIEIETHNEAKAEAIAEAQVVGKKLNSLLVENGFTLIISLAAHNPGNTKKAG